MANENTNDLLTRIANGDGSAANEVISKYGSSVWALARKLTPRNEDAEDAVQEIFLEIWQNAARFDASKASEATFVMVLARRRLIDRLRKVYRRPVFQSLEDYNESAPNVFESSLNDKIEAKRAIRAMSSLKPEQRDLMILNIYEGLSHGEIAERTSMPLGTVKTNIRRGLQRVRETMVRSAAFAG